MQVHGVLDDLVVVRVVLPGGQLHEGQGKLRALGVLVVLELVVEGLDLLW